MDNDGGKVRWKSGNQVGYDGRNSSRRIDIYALLFAEHRYVLSPGIVVVDHREIHGKSQADLSRGEQEGAIPYNMQ